MDLDFDRALDGPGKIGLVTIWDGKATQVELLWGLAPLVPGGKPVSLLRAERWTVVNPCLVMASDFALKTEDGLRYAASLRNGQSFFALAGVWRPATRDWPAAHAVLTVPAYADLAPYKDRHVAVVRQEDWYPWLTQSKPKDEILRPFPKGSFDVIGPPSKRAQPVLRDLFAR